LVDISHGDLSDKLNDLAFLDAEAVDQTHGACADKDGLIVNSEEVVDG
jgi:hypothetical protein